MFKYTIEGNINFQEELYKLLDEESENEDEDDLCHITGLSLKDKFVTLECNHRFNYEALYKEIYKQKYEFKTYGVNSLQKQDLLKFNKSTQDFFIRCPYCRNLQFTVLPYYEELGLNKIYGINSVDEKLKPIFINNNQNYTFNKYGVTFKYGSSCHEINNYSDKCNNNYTANILNTQLYYCKYHYIDGLKKHKISERKKKQELKNLIKKERDKLLEEKNIEREVKGLLPLKRLHVIKKKVENVVEQAQEIQLYVDEQDISCKSIIKSGPNKGKECGCKKIETNGLCKRHSHKTKIKINEEPKIDEEPTIVKNVL